MQYEDQRRWLVKLLREDGIRDERLLDAFSEVPRHEFVPELMREYSYRNQPLAIGEEQTISQPLMIAIMIELMQVKDTDNVLEIGTGSGYQTALLSMLAKEIFTIERIEVLLQRAKIVLKNLNYQNIHFKVGDGTKGWKKAYPPMKEFDKIIVSAASPTIPESLVDQLAENGRLVIPVGERAYQRLILVEKSNGKTITTYHGDCTFVPLIGEEGWQNQ
ncbi:MAG TPA: protein-L-isoaspartate(D-aspartate) O-methyltransferase [Candidatus Cloacimonadota bacterium]|nr:protein-L-isoaspartate(D-aspartate) O-methyltransferase [Candidatus Cloacimonadota bacterium]HPT72351.1 protein-L-isoaspartate(D-aspartate) O-methyltransferase [Candidatus Cloacimonadota bacterium]